MGYRSSVVIVVVLVEVHTREELAVAFGRGCTDHRYQQPGFCGRFHTDIATTFELTRSDSSG